MARIQLIVSDSDRDMFVSQAKREGMSLSAWLRAAARDRLGKTPPQKTFESSQDLEEFFRWCDTLPGPEVEPDWEEQKKIINEPRRSLTDEI